MLRVWLLFDIKIFKSNLLKKRQGDDFIGTDSSFPDLNTSQNRLKALSDRKIVLAVARMRGAEGTSDGRQKS